MRRMSPPLAWESSDLHPGRRLPADLMRRASSHDRPAANSLHFPQEAQRLLEFDPQSNSVESELALSMSATSRFRESRHWAHVRSQKRVMLDRWSRCIGRLSAALARFGCRTRRSAISGMPNHRRDRERGALSLMIVVLFAVLITLVGILVDGAAKLTADESAIALAQEAARAGSTRVDLSSAYASGSFVVDQGQALAAARQYLVDAGCERFTVEAVGTQAIRVSVTIIEPTKFLSLIGVDSITSTGTATASLVTGVAGGA
jgi:hypothetical protein